MRGVARRRLRPSSLSEQDQKLLDATIGMEHYRVLMRRPLTVAVGPRFYVPGLCGALIGFAIGDRHGAAAAFATALIAGVALELSLVAHEAGHLLFSVKAKGVRPRMLVMRSGGGVSIVEGRCEDARSAALFAAGGPIASLVLTIAYIAIGLALPYEPARAGVLLAAMLNLLLLLVNLLPVAPMDGFALFRSAVWAEVGSRAEAERRAIFWSRMALFPVLLVSVLILLTTDRVTGAAGLCLLATLTIQHRAAARRAAVVQQQQQQQQ